MSDQNDDLMSPDASPGQPGKSGVRRVNNLPLYIVLSASGTFLVIMALVAADRAASQRIPEATIRPGNGGDTSMFAKAITGEQTDGMIKAKNPGPPDVPKMPATLDSIAIARPDNLDLPPLPPGATGPIPAAEAPARSPQDDEAARIRMLKLQQFDEAVRAKTAIPLAALHGGAAVQGGGLPAGTAPGRDEALSRLAAVRQQIEASTRDDPTAAFKARLQLLQTGGVGNSPSEAATVKPTDGGAAGPQRSSLAQFAPAGQTDRWRLDASPEAPRSPYELRAGFVVPAVLISGVNSELAGQIVAQVSQDVYDTPLGKYRLIPQGARLVGSYANDIAYGQSRILIAWQRIVFPDGKAMDIGAMPGADSAGYAGFKDKVNNHYGRLFSSAFLMSAVTAGIALSQPDRGNNNSRPTASSALSEALGQQLGQTTAQLISKNLNIAPTLEIRPGYRFNVIVTKDLTFTRPYKGFDY